MDDELMQAVCDRLADEIEELLAGNPPAVVGAAMTMTMASFLIDLGREHGREKADIALAMYMTQVGDLYRVGMMQS